jgi:H+-transporting ATPase
LPPGALVPAYARIVSGSVLVDQSMLTGESVPVEASPGSEVYAGSLVRRGQAIAKVRRLEDGLPEWRAAGLPVEAGAQR